MSEELQNNLPDESPKEIKGVSTVSKELQELLSQKPELQQWRDEIIAEQTEAGKEKQQKYSSLSTQENLSRFFVSLPHTTTGWMIRALSPENALLHSDRMKHLETEQRPYVVIDPFRIGTLGRQHGSFLLREVKNKDDMNHMITAVREWFLSSRPILSSGRMILGKDGRVGRFQEVTTAKKGRKGKLSRSGRAYLATLDGGYELINSQQYARNRLTQGTKTVAEISPKIAQLASLCLLEKTASNGIDEFKNTVRGLVKDIIWESPEGPFFHTRKIWMDYLVKLDGGQYDSTRVYWSAKTLQEGLRDRLGRNAGITEQTILLEQAKDVELFNWKHGVCGAKTGKIDIFEVLENIATDFSAFKEQVKNYVPHENALIFNPFFSFYREWKAFLAQNPENSLEAQQRITRQYMLMTLQEMKMRYAYRDTIPEADQGLLRDRIVTLNKLRERFFPSLPEITLDFSAEKTTINKILKKEISKIHKLFSLGLPSNSATPPETGTPS